MRRGVNMFSDFAKEHSMSYDGLVTLKSNHAVKDTIDRLDAGLAGKGISVFVRIDHAAGAALIDMPLRPTFLLIFGSAKGGHSREHMASGPRSGHDTHGLAEHRAQIKSADVTYMGQ
jgi:hypothetical protein